METIQPKEIFGGETKEDAAGIFLKILEGKGTSAQNNVIHANAGYSIQRFKPNTSINDCIAEAKESVESGNALRVLKRL